MRKTFAALGLVLSSTGCSSTDVEEASSSEQRIINASPIPEDPREGGFVFLATPTAQDPGAGSGILLTNEWVLTAAHVTDQARLANNPGLLWADMGNQSRQAVDIRPHPTWNPKAHPTDPTVTDVALVRVNPPFSGKTYNRRISDRHTFDMIDSGDLTQCVGYAPSTANGTTVISFNGVEIDSPRARAALFEMDSYFEKDKPWRRWATGFIRPRNLLDQITRQGDSGAPCLSIAEEGSEGTEEILGVHHAGVQPACTSNSQCTATPTDSCVIPSGGSVGECAHRFPEIAYTEAAMFFRGFARSTLRQSTSRANLSGAGATDSVTLRLDEAQQYVLDFELQDGTALTLPTFIFDVLDIGAAAQMEWADFDADGLDDLILTLEGSDLGGERFRSSFLVTSTAIGSSWADFLLSGSVDLTAFDFSLGPNAANVELVAFNDDPNADLAVVESSGATVRYIGTDEGLRKDFAPRGLDFDGDGLEDLVMTGRAEDDNDEVDNRVNIAFGGPAAVRLALKQEDIFGSVGFMGATSVGYGDFDGSCRPESTTTCDDELLLGASRKEVGGFADTGSIVYLEYDGAQRELTVDDLPDAPTELGFGHVFAVADFNGDGFDDAAVAANTLQGDDTSVSVIYGGENGLDTDSTVAVLQPGDFGLSETEAQFGWAMTAGDFNCDGWDDLAIGAPWAEIDGAAQAGAVLVIQGGDGLLSDSTSTLIDKSSLGRTPEAGDKFGNTLAAGNFNGDELVGDPCVDLAITAWGEDDGAGAVYVIPGWFDGFDTSSSQRLVEGSSGIGGTRSDGDRFGESLAIMRANADGFDDLIVGQPNEIDVFTGNVKTPGTVHVLLGSSSGIASSGHGFFQHGTEPVPDYLRARDVHSQFGGVVGGTSDGVLAVGTPLQSLQVWGGNELTLHGFAGITTFLQFAETNELLVDERPDKFGEVQPLVGQLSQEWFVIKPADQGFAEFIEGDYLEADWDSLFHFGNFGTPSRARAGSRYAPARRHSELGHELRLENLAESDSIKSKGMDPVPTSDDDGDGISQQSDSCPGTASGQVVDASGCSVDQLCPCAPGWKNNGAYVSCLAHTTNDFVKGKLLTQAQKDAMMAARSSSCPHTKNKKK